MIAPNIYISTPNHFQGKSQAVQDLYHLLLSELNKIGPIQETMKATSVSFENRRAFGSAIIRNRSIKLVLRTNHRISSPRIHSVQHVAEKSYDHTILLESKRDIDAQLLEWLREAYQSGK